MGCAQYISGLIVMINHDLRQISILRVGQPIVDFDAADKCRLYITTIKAMDFQDVIVSIPIDNSKDHYVLEFDLISLQDATDNCHYPELVGETLRLVLNFTFSLNHVNEFTALGEPVSVAIDNFGVVGKKSETHNVSPRQLFNRIPLSECQYLGFFVFIKLQFSQ